MRIVYLYTATGGPLRCSSSTLQVAQEGNHASGSMYWCIYLYTATGGPLRCCFSSMLRGQRRGNHASGSVYWCTYLYTAKGGPSRCSSSTLRVALRGNHVYWICPGVMTVKRSRSGGVLRNARDGRARRLYGCYAPTHVGCVSSLQHLLT